jgi:hypothetical protein
MAPGGRASDARAPDVGGVRAGNRSVTNGPTGARRVIPALDGAPDGRSADDESTTGSSGSLLPSDRTRPLRPTRAPGPAPRGDVSGGPPHGAAGSHGHALEEEVGTLEPNESTNCASCGANFPTSEALLKHRAVAHGAAPPRPPSNPDGQELGWSRSRGHEAATPPLRRPMDPAAGTGADPAREDPGFVEREAGRDRPRPLQPGDEDSTPDLRPRDESPIEPGASSPRTSPRKDAWVEADSLEPRRIPRDPLTDRSRTVEMGPRDPDGPSVAGDDRRRSSRDRRSADRIPTESDPWVTPEERVRRGRRDSELA